MKTLVRVCGVTNLIFAAFHVWLYLHVARMVGVPEEAFELLRLFAVSGVVFILFLGLALTFLAGEVAVTVTGRLVLVLGAATYIVRALGEVVVVRDTSWCLFALCMLVGIAHCIALLGIRCKCCRKSRILPDSAM